MRLGDIFVAGDLPLDGGGSEFPSPFRKIPLLSILLLFILN